MVKLTRNDGISPSIHTSANFAYKKTISGFFSSKPKLRIREKYFLQENVDKQSKSLD
jgi:hypothetical protein